MKYFEVHFHISAPKVMHQDVCDVLAAMAGEAGFETFEEADDGLTGYVQRESFDQTALDNILETLPFGEEHQISITYDVSEAPDRDWNEQWEQEGFAPICVDSRLTIHDGRHLPPTPTPLMVQIDARQAFGTGNHATTRMMCQALMDSGLYGKAVLDCGTGTGILSIVALKCGATEAVGYDIDEWSVTNARHNAELNGVGQRFRSYWGNASIIRQLQRKFDIVAANINRNILLNDMALMRQALPQYHGTMLLSGFYMNDTAMLDAKARSLGMHLEDEREEDGWILLKFSVK